jgi:Spy/CpxP family protein refolding chaperone
MHTMMKTLALLACLAAAPALAQSHGHDHAQPYAGLQTRAIPSLSDDDIAEIRRGGGWGLALPAELSGRPGPAHLLELADELDLSAEQRTRITEIHAAMRAEAIAAGEAFIAAEAALGAAFADPTLDADRLRDLVSRAEAARAALRYVHLSRHLETPPLLTPDQIAAYNRLRGYAPDPCASVPEGHDPAMWKRHNGCE